MAKERELLPYLFFPFILPPPKGKIWKQGIILNSSPAFLLRPPRYDAARFQPAWKCLSLKGVLEDSENDRPDLRAGNNGARPESGRGVVSITSQVFRVIPLRSQPLHFGVSFQKPRHTNSHDFP